MNVKGDEVVVLENIADDSGNVWMKPGDVAIVVAVAHDGSLELKPKGHFFHLDEIDPAKVKPYLGV